ncbi:hypothetical protein NDU88_002531 [Pleurodeles waltl]|uniref:Uncharacterized protein n=1 Tax=Pleurodeles waltl TaxID=8319 RepID=A0AAV7M4F3_PLEWA|nr:hypothetical protein NDU88_002531 [Pleurodeles waltl]
MVTLCDGPAGNGLCTEPTCADPARGVEEQHGARTNGMQSLAMTLELQAGTREEEVVKRPASPSGEKKGEEEESCEKERGKQDKSDKEFGEWFPPAGEKRTKRRKTEVCNPRWPREAKPRIPPRFWRSVAYTGV